MPEFYSGKLKPRNKIFNIPPPIPRELVKIPTPPVANPTTSVCKVIFVKEKDEEPAPIKLNNNVTSCIVEDEEGKKWFIKYLTPFE